jgi:hypothetical protein
VALFRDARDKRAGWVGQSERGSPCAGIDGDLSRTDKTMTVFCDSSGAVEDISQGV